MAFCGSCGAQVQDGIKFCQACGQAVAVATVPPAQVQPPIQNQAVAQNVQPLQQTPHAQQAQVYQPPVVPGAPGQTHIRDAQENKTMALLAYILFFIPLLTGAHKTSSFAKFHTNQGTVLFLASLALSVMFGILSAIITGIFTATYAWSALLTISSIFGLVWLVLGIGITVLAVVGIINAATGKMKPLPIIGRITIIK